MKYLILLTFLLAAFTSGDAFAQTTPTLQAQPTQYLPNGGFENGKAGWVTYKNTAQALPVTGQGGTANSSFTVSTANPINLKASGIMIHPASNVQGEGLMMPFSLDKAARGQMQTISGKYEIVSGTYSGGSGLPTPTDSDIEVYVYDVDAGQVIQPASYKLDGGVIGYTYNINATFQASSTSTNYRLIFHYPTVTTNTFQVRLDVLGIQTNIKTYGVPASSFVAYTPTFTNWGTVSNVSVVSRRVGDSLEVIGSFQSGTTAAATATMSLGYNGVNGGVVSSSIIPAQGFVVGKGNGQFSNTTGFSGISVIGTTSSSVVGFGYETSSTVGYSALYGSSFGNNGIYSFHFTIPIAGWSSNVQMSDQSGDNRVIAGSGYFSNTSLSTSATTLSLVAVRDSTASTATTSYVIPAPGDYSIDMFIASNSGSGSSTDQNVYILVNGTAVKQGTSSGTYFRVTSLHYENLFKAGDVISFQGLVSSGGLSINEPQGSSWSVKRIGGNTQTAIGESVNATYGLTTAQNVAQNANIKYDTKIKDTHNAFNTSTGVYTIPVSGSYMINTVTYSTSGSGSEYVALNGSGVGYISTAQVSLVGAGSFTYPFLAGQQISIRIPDGAVTLGATTSNGPVNSFSITRVGN